MPVQEIGGRNRSIRTDEERAELAERLIGGLSPAEAEALEMMIRQEEIYRRTIDAQYEREPATPEQFIEDEYYLGVACSKMYPKLKDDFIDLFDGGYSTALLGGSLGWGKSYFSSIGLLYVVHQVACLRNPPASFGLSIGTQIELVLISMTKDVVRKRLVPEVESKIAQSRYFGEFLGFKVVRSMAEIRFPRKNLLISGGSSLSVSIGGNVIGGFVDEISYMGSTRGVDHHGLVVAQDKAEVVATQIERRLQSRFQKLGRLPGVLFMASSKERPVAFIEKRIEEAKDRNDSTVFVREYAGWDVKPQEDFSDETFKVAVGNIRFRSVLDPTDEEAQRYIDEGLKVIEVPINFRNDFERDLEGAIRDIAGVETASISPYINRTDKIYSAESKVEQPIDRDEILANQSLNIQWGRIAREMNVELKFGGTERQWFPVRHPDAPRYAHIDLARTGDAAGIVIAHIAGWVDVKRRDRRSNEYEETAPLIETDLILRVLPPPGDEINFGDMRGIIYQFADHGFHFGFVSYDGWQSVDSQQQLNERGIPSDVISIDRTTTHYDTLKMSLYEDRLRLCTPCTCVMEELQDLRRVIMRRVTGLIVKIDHPDVDQRGRKGRKDVADALAGAVSKLTLDRPSSSVSPMLGVREGEEIVVGVPKNRSGRRSGTMPFVRAGRL